MTAQVSALLGTSKNKEKTSNIAFEVFSLWAGRRRFQRREVTHYDRIHDARKRRLLASSPSTSRSPLREASCQVIEGAICGVDLVKSLVGGGR